MSCNTRGLVDQKMSVFIKIYVLVCEIHKFRDRDCGDIFCLVLFSNCCKFQVHNICGCGDSRSGWEREGCSLPLQACLVSVCSATSTDFNDFGFFFLKISTHKLPKIMVILAALKKQPISHTGIFEKFLFFNVTIGGKLKTHLITLILKKYRELICSVK